MNKLSMPVIIAVVVLAAMAVTVRRQHDSAQPTNQATNGAFRDGIYQARLDAQSGRRPHLTSGRWSNDADRASFVSGYEQQYSLLSARSPRPRVSHPADLIGLRDGISDATEDRRQARPFALSSTEVLRIAKSRSQNDSQYARHYAQAYANGYQHGYYGSQETLESISTVIKKAPLQY
jgi:hypothetical protein